MKFLDYQNRWINDTSRLKILEKARRIGGTFGTSYGVWKELMKIRNHDIVAVTRDENLGTEFVGNVTRWSMLWNAVNPNDAIHESNFKRLSLTIPHKDGHSRLIAVSSNPNSSAGKGGSLIIDELALHNDPELLMSVAQPIIMAGGNLSVLSTHRSRNSLFNQLVKDSKKPGSQWSHHRTTIYDAVDQGLVEQVINPKMIAMGNQPYPTRQAFLDWLIATYDEHTFSQEFCCMPADDACSLLSEYEIETAKRLREEQPLTTTGVTYLGYDCAESIRGDYAAICIIAANDQHVEIIEPYYFPHGTKIEHQLDVIVGYAKQYGVRKVISDNAGIGRHPTSILQTRLGEERVVAFDPTMQSKAEMCSKAKRYFQNGKVLMMPDSQIEEDFLSVDRIITASGNVVYHSTRQSDGHADMFSAFAMALTEVPEHRPADIVGVALRAPTPLDAQQEEDHYMSIRERIARNRRLDRKARSVFTM